MDRGLLMPKLQFSFIHHSRMDLNRYFSWLLMYVLFLLKCNDTVKSFIYVMN